MARTLTVLALTLLVFALPALRPSAAHAETTGPAASEARAGASAIGVVPADGKPRGIRLRSQTVNAVISEDASGVWADTSVDVQLQNRGKTPVALPVAVPGPQVASYVTATLDMPQIIDSALDKKALILYPIGETRQPTVRASTVITVPADASVTLRLRYRQAVPVRDSLAAYAYPLQGGNVWAGAPESLSVTVSFAAPLAKEQIMHMTPGARTPRPGAFRWTWNGVKAPANVAVAFVAGAWWRELEGARTAASASGAALAQHVALGERYWHLATLAPPLFAPHASLFEANLPLAVAAWRDGIASARPDTPKPDLARARERLAGLYLAEASRTEHDRGEVYLQLAVNELAEAVALNPGDADLASSATTLQAALAEAATRRGDDAAAAAHLARVQALAAGQAAPAPEQEKQQRAVTLAGAAVSSGDLVGARALLTEGYGANVLQLPDARPPAVTQVLMEVSSRPTGRQIAVRFVDEDQGDSSRRLAQETAEALQAIAPVVQAGNALTVTLAYTDPAALVAAQSRLAAALPRQPELALLSAVLTSRRLAWPDEANLVARTARYEERVDLARPLAVWNAEANKLGAAAAKAAPENGSAEPLNTIRAALWRADARAWRDLAALSRVTYRVELQERGAGPDWLQARVHQFYQEGSVAREWVVRVGETRQLEAAVLGWRYDRLALAAGAALLLAALAVGMIWLIAR